MTSELRSTHNALSGRSILRTHITRIGHRLLTSALYGPAGRSCARMSPVPVEPGTGRGGGVPITLTPRSTAGSDDPLRVTKQTVI